MEERCPDHELDLPLFSNIDEVHVKHYILDLSCSIEDQTFVGCLTVIFDTTKLPDLSSIKIGTNHDNGPTSSIKIGTNHVNGPTSSIKIGTNHVNGPTSSKTCSQDVPNESNEHHVLETGSVNSPTYSDHAYSIQSQPHEVPIKNSVESTGRPLESTLSDEDLLLSRLKLSSFVVILDAWDLEIDTIHKLWLEGDNPYHNIKSDKDRVKEMLHKCEFSILGFHSEKKKLVIQIPAGKSKLTFPYVIKIYYKTKPYGPSLKWTKDQDGRPCVYTHGHWINNRSLFPSQDVPGALATWSAYITVPDDMMVIMSGDYIPVITDGKEQACKTYFYQTEMEVPSSTLALAVGYWSCAELISPHSISDSADPAHILPCRLFSPQCHMTLAQSLLQEYIAQCMEAAYSLLGPHPFRRLDILIVPASFASLGMASPSLMFLSQSVLSEDRHMLVRVAHELSHSWFGLVIGPKDWHEEWLSEGFCTYTESIIHARANKVPDDEFQTEQALFDYMKYNTLLAEQQSVTDDLQILRQSTDDNIKSTPNEPKYVVNGINPDKGFLQVHYVKGYFLLRHLEKKVGSARFYEYLKHFVKSFNKMLVDSMDVLRLYFNMFPEQRTDEFCEETIIETWLNCSGIPKVLISPNIEDNLMTKQVIQLEETMMKISGDLSKLHWRKRQKLDLHSVLVIPQLKIVQVLLLLDRLIRHKKIHPAILVTINKKLTLSNSNPDVRHKWCELVVKHRLSECYSDVITFLENCQAMGVYLFGELIISKDKQQRQLAQDCFSKISAEMDDGVRNVVRMMVYGS